MQQPKYQMDWSIWIGEKYGLAVEKYWMPVYSIVALSLDTVSVPLLNVIA